MIHGIAAFVRKLIANVYIALGVNHHIGIRPGKPIRQHRIAMHEPNCCQILLPSSVFFKADHYIRLLRPTFAEFSALVDQNGGSIIVQGEIKG